MQRDSEVDVTCRNFKFALRWQIYNLWLVWLLVSRFWRTWANHIFGERWYFLEFPPQRSHGSAPVCQGGQLLQRLNDPLPFCQRLLNLITLLPPSAKHTSTSASTHSIYIDKWGQFWPPSLSNRVMILDWFLANTGFGLSFPSRRWKNDRDQEREQPAETDCGRGQLAAERIVGLSLPPRKIVRSNRAPHHPSKIYFNVEQYFL